VRREVGTDEPIEVVEVEQNYDAAHVPKCVFTQSSCICEAKVLHLGSQNQTLSRPNE